jgi:dihydropteroate synthase
MGILNVTPDSFSDGGRYFDPEAALDRALELEAEGADILDVGGESTRPGSTPVSAEVELARVLPVLRKLRGRLKIPLSIDTWKSPPGDGTRSCGREWRSIAPGMCSCTRWRSPASRTIRLTTTT